jgi:hypothetical protein
MESTGGANIYSASAEVFDIVTNTWTAVANMSTARSLFGMASLGGGAVIVAGGCASDWDCESAVCNAPEVFKATSNVWTSITSMSVPRISLALGSIIDAYGRYIGVLAAGGWNDNTGVLSSTEIFDATTNMWTPAANMSTPRFGFALAALGDNRLLAVGGCIDNFNCETLGSTGLKAVASAELFVPSGYVCAKNIDGLPMCVEANGTGVGAPLKDCEYTCLNPQELFLCIDKQCIPSIGAGRGATKDVCISNCGNFSTIVVDS